MNLAVFDVDGTLYACNTLLLFSRMQREGIFFMRLADSLPVKLLDRLPFVSVRRALALRSLAPIAPEELNRRAQVFVKHTLGKYARKSAMRLIQGLKKRGYRVMLASSGPDFLVENCAKVIGVDLWISSRYKNGRFCLDLTGKKERHLPPYDKLFVCTDNKSDKKLLAKADSAVVYSKANQAKSWRAICPKAFISITED